MRIFASATWALFKREILRFVRQRSRWIGALLTPLLFWALMGGGFGSSFRDPSAAFGGGGRYAEFFFPGSIALAVLFTAIFSTISIIQDRHEGFLQGVLVAPVPRSAFVCAKILSGAALGLMQGALLMIFSPMAGLHAPLFALLQIFVLLFFMAASLTALGFVFAWKIDSVQGFHGIMNIVFMPMWILSGSLFPAAGSQRWLGLVMKINPLTYAVDSLRALFAGAPHDGMALALAVMGAMLALLFGLSVRLVNQVR